MREATACRESGESKTILTALFGHGHLDLAAYEKFLHEGFQDVDLTEEELARGMASIPDIAVG